MISNKLACLDIFPWLQKCWHSENNPQIVCFNLDFFKFFFSTGMRSAKRMLLNKGEDDEIEIHGYRRNKLKTILTYISFVLTLGLSRLVFHWMPHWYLYATSSIIEVTHAENLLVIVSSTNNSSQQNYFFSLVVVQLLTITNVNAVYMFQSLSHRYLTLFNLTSPLVYRVKFLSFFMLYVSTRSLNFN